MYLYRSESEYVPEMVTKAADAIYGDSANVHHLTALLCEACDNSPALVSVYPDLSEWWERHQEWDDRKDFQKEYVRQLLPTTNED